MTKDPKSNLKSFDAFEAQWHQDYARIQSYDWYVLIVGEGEKRKNVQSL